MFSRPRNAHRFLLTPCTRPPILVCGVISGAGGSAAGSARGRCRWAGRAGRWPEGLSGELKPLPIIQRLSSNGRCRGRREGCACAKTAHASPVKLTRGAWLDVLPCMLTPPIASARSSRDGDGDARPGASTIPAAGGRRGPCSRRARRGTSPWQGPRPPNRAQGKGACAVSPADGARDALGIAGLQQPPLPRCGQLRSRPSV